jgi:subtilisin family serine protease
MIGRVPAKVESIYETALVLERAVVSVQYFFPTEGSGGEYTLVKIIDPTPGTWTVTVYGDIVLNGICHAWLPITGVVDPSIVFVIPSPDCTLTIPACSIGNISVGAFNGQDESLYPESSWGPTRLPLMGPDFTAPGVNVQGYFPGGLGVMSGTSAAAAVTAGACALMLQWGIVQGNYVAMNSYRVKAFLVRGCERDTGGPYPNERWGYGRMNLYNTFVVMRG